MADDSETERNARNQAGADAYDASKLSQLKGLEAVRKQPGLYIGGTDETALKPAEARLAGKDIAYEKVKLVGDPAAEIVRHAAHRGCDLIVMGTHGHTALSNLVLGSVATKVIASTKIPVLLLR